MMASIKRSQTYPPVLPLCKPRKDLTNWTCVDLRNPRPKIRTSRDTEEFLHEQSKWTDNETIDRQDKQQKEEEDQIQPEGNNEKQKESLENVE